MAIPEAGIENGVNGHNDHQAGKSMQALRMIRDKSPTSESSYVHSLQLENLPVPTITPGNILVQIYATSVNPSDAANARGFFPYTTFPRVPGRDFAGVVVNGPTYLQGKRVFGTSGHDLSFTKDGACAEFCLVSERGVAVMPSGLTFVQAATIGVAWTTAWLMLERAHTKSTDTVLIIGANGAVGSAACQLARERGCKIITAARSGPRDIDTTSDPTLSTAKSLTLGKGPSVILDTVGDPDLMKSALAALPVRGRLSYIAAPKSYEASFDFDMKQFYRMEKVIIGCNSLSYDSVEMTDILRELGPKFGTGGCYSEFDMSRILEVKLGQEALDAYATVGGSDPGAPKSKGMKFVITI